MAHRGVLSALILAAWAGLAGCFGKGPEEAGAGGTAESVARTLLREEAGTAAPEGVVVAACARGGVRLRGVQEGSMTASPAGVGNQSRPSGVRQPAGGEPPVHSRPSSPSLARCSFHRTAKTLPAASSSRSERGTSETPLLELNQRWPRRSSRRHRTR